MTEPSPHIIASVLTPPGKGGIAIIALHGPGAAAMLRMIFRPWKSHVRSEPGVLQLGHLVGENGQVLDEAVVQGQGDCALINIHGGPWVTQAVMDLLRRNGAVATAGGVAPAAFDPAHPKWKNPAIGREMLAVLPQLQSPLALAAVANQWSAGLSQFVHRLRELHEEKRDKKNDEDVPPPLSNTAANDGRRGALCAAARSLRRAAEAMSKMRRLIEPAEVVLAGPPNAGKSTLANALSGRPMSIVHETPGTTRDWVRELVLIRGVPIWLTDTAGIWEVPGGSDAAAIDAAAVRRAHERLRQADLIVLLGEAPDGLVADAAPAGRPLLRVQAKADEEAALGLIGPSCDLAVSAQTGQGLSELRDAILAKLGLADLDPTAAMAFTPRQADLLHDAAAAIEAGDGAQAADKLRKLLG